MGGSVGDLWGLLNFNFTLNNIKELPFRINIIVQQLKFVLWTQYWRPLYVLNTGWDDDMLPLEWFGRIVFFH